MRVHKRHNDVLVFCKVPNGGAALMKGGQLIAYSKVAKVEHDSSLDADWDFVRKSFRFEG